MFVGYDPLNPNDRVIDVSKVKINVLILSVQQAVLFADAANRGQVIRYQGLLLGYRRSYR